MVTVQSEHIYKREKIKVKHVVRSKEKGIGTGVDEGRSQEHT